MDESIIVWSDLTYTLKAFVKRFPTFPHLVQVESGLYSQDDAQTLSAGQILKLHLTKRTDKVLAKATGVDKEFFIPVNSACKVEILPTVCEDVYYSVQEVVDATCVKFIRVVHDSPPSYRLKAGDILEIIKTVEENRAQFIECEFVNKTRDNVKLPLDYKAAFEPLAKAEQYDFLDALHRFELPVRVKFISSEITLDDVGLPPVGSVLLKEKREESTIICTSRADGKVTVLMIPTDLDVCVIPAQGALVEDQEYVRICKNIHDGVDLEKVDLSLMNASRLCNEKDEDPVYDYAEVRPLIPRRSHRESESGSDDEYSYVDVPPSRPPKPDRLKSPAVNCLKSTPSPKPSGCSDGNFQRGPARPTVKIPAVSRTHSDQHSTKTAASGAPKSYYNVPHVPEQPAIRPPQTQPRKPKVKAGTETVAKDEELRDDEVFCKDGGGGDEDDDDSDADYISMDEEYGTDGDTNARSDRETDFHSAHEQSNPERKSHSEGMTRRLSFAMSRLKSSIKTLKGTKNTSAPSQSSPPVGSPKKEPLPSPPVSEPTPSFTFTTTSTVFPDDLSCLSVSEVGECLKRLNLQRYVETFESRQIDGEMLAALNDESFLTSLGVTDVFDRKKLMKFILGWRPKL